MGLMSLSWPARCIGPMRPIHPLRPMKCEQGDKQLTPSTTTADIVGGFHSSPDAFVSDGIERAACFL